VRPEPEPLLPLDPPLDPLEPVFAAEYPLWLLELLPESRPLPELLPESRPLLELPLLEEPCMPPVLRELLLDEPLMPSPWLLSRSAMVHPPAA
jgi:hypothetical protein